MDVSATMFTSLKSYLDDLYNSMEISYLVFSCIYCAITF